MDENNILEVIETQILQIESFLWEQDFETPFRVKRLVGDMWELISWKENVGRFRLSFTRLTSLEHSGGTAELNVVLADANDETKLKTGPYLESFMLRYSELNKILRDQTSGHSNTYLSSMKQKIAESSDLISHGVTNSSI